ncbi:hypothetical protein [Streptomyces iconiensis]|uniref:Uncharacterized protein n=1 Tax=Streptomyces iconiensis TaxID=1384038 RepID=A0ABT7A6C2_9ACTN|nr:hypothetical protein [Streptomyces iconiensis]MDJ1136879.1 hypothetical protein [Streptomyces iconiensis]
MSFTFGIYPSGDTGAEADGTPMATPDEPERIAQALRDLQGGDRPFRVRAYRSFAETGTTLSYRTMGKPTTADNLWVSLVAPERYATEGRSLDLVLAYQEESGRLDAWLEFIRATVRESGAHISSLQICEEPNVDNPILDGSMPNVLQALVEGVIAAKDEALKAGHSGLQVGFNAAVSLDPDDAFWKGLGALADERFHGALDYVGFDCFPDVFMPVPMAELTERVEGLLTFFRGTSLTALAGIDPAVPLRIAENGWATGPGRPEERQAEVIETVVRTVYGQRDALTIDGYCLYALRDADSSSDDKFHRFGIMRDDYTPRPAFDTYRRLVAELTV